MPSRNVTKYDVEHSFYHIYARGTNKQPIFLVAHDYAYFVNLFARYLSKAPAIKRQKEPYPHYYNQLELLAYCLMQNHFHLLVYQVDLGAMSAFMKSLMTSYSLYFNRKYRRTGSLFESRYKAAMIDADNYLQHISRYIHLNPRFWKRFPYSSLQLYIRGNEPEWLMSEKVLGLFESRHSYLEFVEDYEAHKQMLAEIKHELADS